ncbi:MAG: glycosyltransferase family 2 protein [Candidatus Levybacteria bacterium]|nr:glycosyltransferase family 2 protein [Candidatus Levybacteria bacterium]
MISFVIPVFNEEESLTPFYEDLKSSLKDRKEYEIVFIDDGSTDKSLRILKDLHSKNSNIRIFSFRKNQGKSEALTLGFGKAKGDCIVTLDADLQDRPSEAPKLIEKLKEEDFDLACGWRKNRKDPLRKVISSKFFNFLASFFWGLKLHDYNCGLKAYAKDAAKSLRLYGGMHRFIPLLVHEQGFKVCEMPVNHDERKYGKSKYGFSKLWNDLPDIFTMLFLTRYSKRPLHFFGPIGFIFLTIGGAILAYLFAIKIMGQGIGDRPLLFLGMILVLSGFQVLFTGFLADIIINTSSKETKDFPIKYSSEK